jgi:type IV pilus assembly protein PilM
MSTPIGVWGIDLGQCALKAIRLQDIGGQMTATAFDYVEHPKILSQPDADPDALTREALEKFLSRNSLRGDFVAISVPGQSGLARFVKLPPVEEKKIVDIVRFEAKQQIPFNLEEVVWDFQKISQGAITDGFAMETEIGLFAMKRDMVSRYIQHFGDVRIEVHLIQMSPLALCNFVAYDLLQRNADGSTGGGAGEQAEGEEEEGGGKVNCVVALDIGADSSNLVITDGNRIIWQRPIPLGGNHFTRALTKDLKLTFAKAEHVKRNATKSPDLKKILTSLRPVLNDFVSEVQRSLAFFTNTHRDASVEYMIGLGNAFRLPGLQKYLAEKLQLDVRKLNKMERLQGDAVVTQQAYTENILSFAVAYGLALQGLNQARLVTNLLPHEIRFERMVRAKKPWAVAAAGMLLLGCGAWTYSYYLDDRPYNHPKVASAMKDSDKAAADAVAAVNKFKDAKSKALAEQEAVRTIVAGQMERRNWLHLLKFVEEGVPKPDASNLLNTVMKKKYFDTHELPKHYTGKQAFDLFKKMQDGATPAAKDDEGAAARDPLPPFMDDLILFNIEGIDCRYTDNLAGFWNEARALAKEQENFRPIPQFSDGPEGGGWVVELRGYTFHHGKAAFVRNVLLDNLAAVGIPPKPEEAAGGKEPAAKPGPPAPPTTGKAAPPPATGKPAPPPATGKPPATQAAPAAPPNPDGPKKLPGEPDHPVIGQVSHFALVYAQNVQASEGSSGGPSFLDRVGRGGGGGGEGGAAGANKPGAGTMRPPAAAGGGDRPPGGGAAPPGGGGWSPLVGAGAGAPAGGGTTNHQRTDFTIVFFWKEWTPSDALRNMEGAAPPAPKK